MEANSLLNRTLTQLFAPRCCQCGQPCQTWQQPLCDCCSAQLPLWVSGCPVCAMPYVAEPSEDLVCGDCQQHPKPYNQVKVLGWYQGSLKRLISRFKYHEDLIAGKALSQVWLTHQTSLERPEVLIPVPCHAHKLAQRGFNQATFLADRWSRALSIPMKTQLCRRLALGTASISQTKQERFKQVKRLYQTAPCPYSHVALVDDVVTSQATAITLAQQLLRQGAKRVDVWALARTP